ncbi:MAG: LysM peptidoglycan-binding domain-containing protein [Gammaproteobacteria bacterium]|nr:LysM peptidoglycan-binding domain-containing protein [Gammaproteobacteria bacterium]
MPDVRYTFRAEDRTRGPIDRIRRRINSLGGRASNIRVNVQAEGLDRIRRELDGLRDSSVRIDILAGDEAGLAPLRDLRERREVVIDYILGSTAGSDPYRDIPESAAIRVDYELGSTAGAQPFQDAPSSIPIRVDYELGSTAGADPARSIPESASILIDYTLGSTAGIDPLKSIPESASIRIDYTLGSDAGAAQLRDLPEKEDISIDYELGSTAGAEQLKSLPESVSIRVDYDLGSTAGAQPFQDMPESAAIRVDYTLGSTAGVQKIPESISTRVDYELGSTAGAQPFQDAPSSIPIRVDYELGSTAGAEPYQDMPESATIRVDYELGSTAGVQDIPESVAIRVDYELGSTEGLNAFLNLGLSGTAMDIRVDYSLGEEAGIKPHSDLDGQTATVTVDYEAGSTAGLQPGAPAAASAPASPGLPIDPSAALTSVGAGYGALQLMQQAGRTIDSWQNLQQAVADTERLYFANTGERFTEDQRRQLVQTGQGISAVSDVSTREAIGAVFMGLQQGRSFEAMTTGGLAQTLINTSMGAKGLGMGTLEALPYTISAITDIMDALVGVDADVSQDRASRMMLAYVGGGKGDVTNFARVMGDISPIARMLGWSPEEALGTALVAMPGFARPGMASTGTRNMLRDLVQGQGKDSLFEFYEAAGWVAPGSVQRDAPGKDGEPGKIQAYRTEFFDPDTGLMKSPEKFFELLQELNNADVVDPARIPEIMSKIFTIEAMAAADFIRISDAQQKYQQVQETLANADVDAMRQIYIETLSGQDEVLSGMWEDAMWQMSEVFGGPEAKAAWQNAQRGIIGDIGQMYAFDAADKSLRELATPERFGFFQERGLARSLGRQYGPARPDAYQVAGHMPLWRTGEGLAELNALLQAALAYQPSAAPVSADIQEIAAGMTPPTGGARVYPGPGGPDSLAGRGGSHTVVSGDTLSEIAAAQGLTLDELIALNPQIANPNLITPGQRVNLSGGGDVNITQRSAPPLSQDILDIAEPADPYRVPATPLPGGRNRDVYPERPQALTEEDMYASQFATGVADFTSAVLAFAAAVGQGADAGPIGLPPPLGDEIAPPAYGYGDTMPPGQQRAMYGDGPAPVPLPGGRQPASYFGPDAAQGIAAFTQILTGLLPQDGLPIDTSALEDIGVGAKVTTLDTSQVENQVINLRANVLIDEGGGAGGYTPQQRIQQDRTTQRRNTVSAATYDAGRQRAGGGGEVGENFFR